MARVTEKWGEARGDVRGEGAGEFPGRDVGDGTLVTIPKEDQPAPKPALTARPVRCIRTATSGTRCGDSRSAGAATAIAPTTSPAGSRTATPTAATSLALSPWLVAYPARLTVARCRWISFREESVRSVSVCTPRGYRSRTRSGGSAARIALPAEVACAGSTMPTRSPTRSGWGLSTPSTKRTPFPSSTTRCTVSPVSSDSARRCGRATWLMSIRATARSPMSTSAGPGR